MKPCSPSDIALKSFFLGPQSENSQWLAQQVNFILESWFKWRKESFPEDGRAISSADQSLPEFKNLQEKSEKILAELMNRFEKEIPKFSPRYIGHMFSEISMPALLGHIVSLLHNPNNISIESSKAGVFLEKQAVAYLAEMLNYPAQATGHFTSGGTLANFEALSRAIERTHQWLLVGRTQRRKDSDLRTLMEWAHAGWGTTTAAMQNPSSLDLYHQSARAWSNPLQRAKIINEDFGVNYEGGVILVPDHKHYSWIKGAHIFSLGDDSLWPVRLDRHGRMDVQDLNQKIKTAFQKNRPIHMCVSVFGTTELGSVDPINEVCDLLDEWKKKSIHIWHHCDAAFGGFFASLKNSDQLSPHLKSAIDALSRTDSITIDPHKMGYVPYSSGAFLAKNERDYRILNFSGPYLQIDESSDKGPYTLEGSRSTAGAAATWLTAQSIGLNNLGYGRILKKTILSRTGLEEKLKLIPGLHLCEGHDLNILGIYVALPGDSFASANAKTNKLFEALNHEGFFLSKTTLTQKSYGALLTEISKAWNNSADISDLDIIRICVMNPFFDSKEFHLSFPDSFFALVQRSMSHL